jgi:uncharacterized protein (TIGR02145 family)
LKEIEMKKAKAILIITGVLIFLFSYGNMSGNIDHSVGFDSNQTNSKSIQTTTKSAQTVSKTNQTKAKSTQTVSKSKQTKTKSTQTGSKSAPVKSKPIQKSPKPELYNKIKDSLSVTIGIQSWARANLNVSTFRNGDIIPEARTNNEWVTAGETGKPAWCYYNNDPANGLRYGKLYNWYAVNDPRGLAPVGWVLSTDADWVKLTYSLGGQEAAGNKLKSTTGWIGGNNGNNESGFMGFPGGYRIENGIFQNAGSIGIWWSATEGKSLSAIDHYVSLSNSLSKSSSPKQRGESVRCLRN